MSLEELRADLRRNMQDANTVIDDQTRGHLKNTLWPFLEAIIDVVEEMDDAVAELVDQQEDYLQPETAAVFAAVIQSSLGLVAELRKRAAGDANIMAAITQHEQICQQALIMLGEVTMVSGDDGEDDGEEDGDATEAEEDDNE